MKHKRIDLPLTLSDCEAIAALPKLYKHGIAMPSHDLHPFKLTKPSSGSKMESSRFELNGLSFQGKEVARVGFRNKNAFMLIREGLPQQVEDAIQKRVMGMARFAKKGKRILNEEIDMLDHQVSALMETYSAIANDLDGPDFSYDPRVRIMKIHPATAYNAIMNEVRESSFLDLATETKHGEITLEATIPQYKIHKPLAKFAYVDGGLKMLESNVEEDRISGMLARGAANHQLPLTDIKDKLKALELSTFETKVILPSLLKGITNPGSNFSYAKGRSNAEGDSFGLLLIDGSAVASFRAYTAYYPKEMKVDIKPVDGLADQMRISQKKLKEMMLGALAEATNPNNSKTSTLEDEKGWVDELARAVQGTDFGYGV